LSLKEFLEEWNNSSDRLLVHTSGSTGQPKPLWVEKRRMEASARITCDFLGLQRGDTALLCLSLDYIAGKMMVVRSLIGGLHLVSVPPDGHPLLSDRLPAVIDFAAMVPLQVYNALQSDTECDRLRHIRHLIIGGGAIDDLLAVRLRDFPNAVWSTYGMTETLSHVALRRLSGPEASEWYSPFPSVSLSLNADGCLVIDAPAVCAERLVTNDIAELLSDGRFRILGRRDNVVCTGGLKVQMEEVERRLRQHTDLPLLITKCTDTKLGEAVVLLCQTDDTDSLRALCQQVLPRYWQPRHFITVGTLPTTANGKPARAEARRLAEAFVNK